MFAKTPVMLVWLDLIFYVFFFQIYDYIGKLFYLCGFRNNTEVDTVESRLNHLYFEFKTDGIISARGFNFSYEILSSKYESKIFTRQYVIFVNAQNFDMIDI